MKEKTHEKEETYTFPFKKINPTTSQKKRSKSTTFNFPVCYTEKFIFNWIMKDTTTTEYRHNMQAGQQ